MSKRRKTKTFLDFGKIKPNESDSLQSDFLKVTIMNITLFFIFISPIISSIEAFIHRNDSDLTFYHNNLITLGWTTLFLILIFGFMRFTFVSTEYYKARTGPFTKLTGNEIVLLQSASAIPAVLAIWFITWFAETFRLEVQPYEIVIFYANAAISEEIWFRMFGITFAKNGLFLLFKFLGVLQGKDKKRMKETIINISAVAITALIFMIAHLGVYAGQPIVLLSTLFAGIIFGTLFVVYKNNPLPGLVGHVFNNIVAAFIIIAG